MSASGLPRGELLGRYTSYLDAQKLVDYLADNDFPVASVTIVGNDLRTVERVTAKLSYPKVALAGAAQGAMMGFFVGLLLSLFSPGSGLYQILSAIGLGMAIWMIAGVISYSMRRGKRDFASSSQFVATSYDVVVDFANAHAARALAAKLPMHPGQAQQAAGPVAPAPTQQPPVAPPVAPTTPVQQPPAQPDGGQPEANAPSGTFPDLPDGRPRYGVRVTPAAPAAEPSGEAAGPQEPKVASGATALGSQQRPADAQSQPDRDDQPATNTEEVPRVTHRGSGDERASESVEPGDSDRSEAPTRDN